MPVTVGAGFAAANAAKGGARGGAGDGLWRLGRWSWAIYATDRRAREPRAQMPDRRVFRLILRGAPPVGHLEPIRE